MAQASNKKYETVGEMVKCTAEDHKGDRLLPLSSFTETKDKDYVIQADGKRYKLNMCKQCRKDYNAQKKREQRVRERETIVAAKAAGEEIAVITVSAMMIQEDNTRKIRLNKK